MNLFLCVEACVGCDFYVINAFSAIFSEGFRERAGNRSLLRRRKIGVFGPWWLSARM